MSNGGNNRWTDASVLVDDEFEDEHDTFLDRLRSRGVLAEADRIWDRAERGENICDPEPLDDVLAEAQRRRRA